MVYRSCKQCNAIFLASNTNAMYCPICKKNLRAQRDAVYRKSKNTGQGKGWSSGMQFAPRQVCQECGGLFRVDPARIKKGGGKFCSKQCYASHLAKHPEKYPQTSGRRGKGGIREDLGRYFRSMWEANFARYLNFLVSHKQIKSWEYETETFEFKGIKRGTRFYTPDFIVMELSGSKTYYEIKGYMDAPSQTKLSRMERYYPQIKITLVDKDAYYEIARKVGRLIPNWESRNPSRPFVE